ncbi:IS1595 family transposase [Micromonospora sp. NPDC049679]|uniref:IS1595 family transposase n=1 Tax=Micromonospora sp. NPDC049679 TaxID=3155920 RepID=UPI00340AF7AE
MWFEAAWLMMTSKAGTSALNLQRVLRLGSYQTAWTMLHRYPDVMVVPERELLSGNVEVDETFIGGKNKPGKRGRGAAGKILVAGAIERTPGGHPGFGRARLVIIPNATAGALGTFIRDNIAPASNIITDALLSYSATLAGSEDNHTPINVHGSGQRAHQLLPGVHRLFSLSKRWLEGTHQGAVESGHLQSYLDEFIFRFNRSNARQRGLLFVRLLERAVEVGPIRYVDVVANPSPTCRPGLRPSERQWPGSLAVPALHRPWREA